MSTLKSRTLFVEILTAMYNDSIISKKDLVYLQSRVKREGEYILLHKLPLLAKAVERGLETGYFIIPDNTFKRYRLKGQDTNITCLFKEMLLSIFDYCGALKSSVDAQAIANLRQVCYAFNKIIYDFTPLQLSEAEDKFAAVDSEVMVDYSNLSIRDLTILNYAKETLNKLFIDFDLRNIIPRHGSGATADHYSHVDRRSYLNLRYFRSLHERYPLYTFNYGNAGCLAANVATYWAAKANGQKHTAKSSSRLACVPKDARGPRVICIEPHEFMWVQQGQMRELYSHIERHPLTAGLVNFTDQTINQRLAEQASIDRGNCTIDLKDASDRVSKRLVELLFPPHIAVDLMASRTGKASLPKKMITIVLRKFASMGNALTFPIEALVFWSLATATLKYDGLRGRVYVYGDDIICPSNAYLPVTSTLERFGLRVNQEKSFAKGFFRESCGGDYYNGYNVTPVRIRRLDNDAKTLLSIRDSARQFFERGLWHLTKLFDSLEERIAANLRVRVGYTSPTVDGSLSRLQIFTKSEDYSYLGNRKSRYNPLTQSKELKLPCLKVVAEYGTIDDSMAYLLKLTTGWKVDDTIPDVFVHCDGSNALGTTLKWFPSQDGSACQARQLYEAHRKKVKN